MRITQRQAKALEGSVRKWRKIVKGTGVDMGIDNCPLCKLYYKPDCTIWSQRCKGCPIFIDTSMPACYKTPMDDAQAMLSYLEDLLARCTLRKGK